MCVKRVGREKRECEGGEGKNYYANRVMEILQSKGRVSHVQKSSFLFVHCITKPENSKKNNETFTIVTHTHTVEGQIYLSVGSPCSQKQRL